MPFFFFFFFCGGTGVWIQGFVLAKLVLLQAGALLLGPLLEVHSAVIMEMGSGELFAWIDLEPPSS
jgi:hypothetical protein